MAGRCPSRGDGRVVHRKSAETRGEVAMKMKKLRVLSACTLLVGLGLVSAVALAQDPLPSWNDGKAKQAIVAFVEKVTKEGAPDLRPGPRAHRHVRQRRDAVGRAADVLPVPLRARPRQGACPPASRVEDHRALRLAAQGQPQGRPRGRRTGDARDRHGDPRGHDHRGVRDARPRLDCRRQAPEDRPAVHRDGLPAHARTARLPARERLQDLHRLRRRHRVHAPVDRRRSTASRPSR